MGDDYGELQQRLEAIAEEIGDLAFNQLRAGVENADKDSIAEERRLVRARRAVEKAVHLLSGSS